MRGEVWLVALDPTVGHEQRGVRRSQSRFARMEGLAFDGKRDMSSDSGPPRIGKERIRIRDQPDAASVGAVVRHIERHNMIT